MAKVLPFSNRVVNLLQSMPGAGGTHRWMARIAAGLAVCCDREDAFTVLRTCCDRFVSHRRIPDREIEASVSLAYDNPSGGSAKRRPMVEWPDRNEASLAIVLEKTVPMFDGETDTGVTADEALDVLFKPGEWVCASWICEQACVYTREEWKLRASTAQFICVNPVKGVEPQMNKENKPSVRCQANIAMRRWIVAEFDDPLQSKLDQAKIATVLSKGMPLRMVVHSGSKSLHAWFYVEGREEHDVARFFWMCCALGADRTRWDPCGWLRMPGGLRRKDCGGSVKQKIVYINLEMVAPSNYKAKERVS